MTASVNAGAALARLPGGELERAAAFTRSGEMEAAMQLPGYDVVRLPLMPGGECSSRRLGL